MNDWRTKLAVLTVVLGLGGLGGYAMSSNRKGAVQAATTAKPATEVIRRTVHKKPRHQHSAGSASPGAALARAPVSSGSSGSSYSAPVSTGSSGSGSGSSPVHTGTSGSGGGGSTVHTGTSGSGGGGESEGGDRGEGGGGGGDD